MSVIPESFPYFVPNLNMSQKKCFRNHAKRAEQLLKKNLCSYWKLLINCNCSNNDIPKQLSFNGSVSSNKQGAADLLVSYFSSVYSNN